MSTTAALASSMGLFSIQDLTSCFEALVACLPPAQTVHPTSHDYHRDYDWLNELLDLFSAFSTRFVSPSVLPQRRIVDFGEVDTAA
jgi:hypothetical protein